MKNLFKGVADQEKFMCIKLLTPLVSAGIPSKLILCRVAAKARARVKAERERESAFSAGNCTPKFKMSPNFLATVKTYITQNLDLVFSSSKPSSSLCPGCNLVHFCSQGQYNHTVVIMS